MCRIRKATDADIPWIIKELSQFASEYGTKKIPFGEDEYIVDGLQKLIKDHLFLIAEGQEPMGLIAGFVSGHFFNPKIRALHELFWWVPQKHRGTRAGYLLLKAFIDYGKSNCDWVSCSIEAISPVNPMVLEKRGFRLQERSYLMEVA